MSYQQGVTRYVLRVSSPISGEDQEIDVRNTFIAVFLLISSEDTVLCLLAVRTTFVLLGKGVLVRYTLWGYPGAYPGTTETIRFWYPGTLRVLYPVHARELPKQSSLAPGYPIDPAKHTLDIFGCSVARVCHLMFMCCHVSLKVTRKSADPVPTQFSSWYPWDWRGHDYFSSYYGGP